MKATKKTLNLDDIDSLLGKEEIRHRNFIKRIQKKCPHDFKYLGADQWHTHVKCVVCDFLDMDKPYNKK